MADIYGADQMVSQVGLTCSAGYEGALAMIVEIKPRDVIEAMLASQMVTANNLALKSAGRAVETDVFYDPSLDVERASKMMRVFAGHVEALSRYRGKGQQKVVVEHQHVTVNQGGQAVVAATVEPRVHEKGINPRKGRGEGHG